MIVVCVDAREVLAECKDYNFTPIVNMIVNAAPRGLKTNNTFIGNSLYKIAVENCDDSSIDYDIREKFQEYIFDNYRVSGILDSYTDISVFM